jgi:protein SCO1
MSTRCLPESAPEPPAAIRKVPGARPSTGTVLACCIGLAAAWLIGCQPTTTPPDATAAAPTAYAVTGLVHRLQPDARTVIIQHDAIPDYMQAMTMPFVARDPRQLRGLTPGDQITFRLLVTETDAWIDQVRKTGRREELTSPAPDDLLNLVDELDTGDLLPDVSLVNDHGQSFQLSDLRGRVVGLTFLFTRCPLPTYCPLLSRHFAAAHKELLASDPATPWHLLTVSFDPDFDSPRVLGMYARQYRTDTNHWTFATGEREAIEQFGQKVGLMLVREPGTISHNLRTLVVTPSGHIQHVFRDNDWEPSGLVAQMRAADPAAASIPGDSPWASARLAISGMSCQACARAIQTALNNEPGVADAAVSFDTGQAELSYDPLRTAPARLIKLLRELNYDGQQLPWPPTAPPTVP